MDFLNAFLGILLIILGVYLVRLTEEIKINDEGRFAHKIGVAGIISVMIGVVLIIIELTSFLFF
ncbi:MAG: hypothetical protein DRI75_04905 [Bacteroidetes bacterium]|nr:MAG: hypothetical protein DRI75_04905 [Bacteroidota bacterium]